MALDELTRRPPRGIVVPPPDSGGTVDHACRLAAGLLVVVGELPGPAAEEHAVARRLAIPTRCLRLRLHDVDAYLAVVEVPEHPGACFLDLDGRILAVDADELAERTVDPQTLAWVGLAGLDPVSRRAATAFLASATLDERRASGRRAIADALAQVHEALRERLAPCVIAEDRPQGLFLDALHAVDERSFYVRGWVRSTDAPITSLVFVSPEGARAEVADSMFRFPRPDVAEFYGVAASERAEDRSGFLAYFELDAPSLLPGGWTAELRDGAGNAVEATVPAVLRDPARTRDTVLADLAFEAPPGDTLLRDHAFPAVSKLQERNARRVAIESVVQHGTPPAAPEVTVIVPLYRRIDFLEHQLAQFAHDPELAAADLVYVLDSPELADALDAQARQLGALYRIPFRVVTLAANVGFAGANNAGASVARGRLLLLLNSDVLPDRPGWLGRMVAFHDSTPDVGAVGPKLLYEDGSIQHAGLHFVRAEGSEWWENDHYWKGLHRGFPAACRPRPVPGVTGACLLVATDRYHEVGGLQGAYVQGDYEDSDLCLRLGGLGLEHWYVPDVELFHLEGQSYTTDLRRLTSRYNTWLHTHLWGERIAAVHERFRTAPEPAPASPAPAPSSRAPRRRTRTARTTATAANGGS